MHGAFPSAPWIATGAGNGAGLATAHAISVAAFAAAAGVAAFAAAVGSVALPARSDDSSNSSDNDSDIIGGGCTASGRKTTGSPKFPDQQPLDDYFSAGGDDVDNDMDEDMPADAEASKYSFLDRLKHYMEWAFITEDNRKAVELVIMVEVGTTMREMDPMKKDIKEKAFLTAK